MTKKGLKKRTALRNPTNQLLAGLVRPIQKLELDFNIRGKTTQAPISSIFNGGNDSIP
jgi:hypothetical protein